jgi:hypothetical protein
LDFYFGDGVDSCEPTVPEVVGLLPDYGYSEDFTPVFINFVYPVVHGEYLRRTAFCRFGAAIVPADYAGEALIQCRSPPHPPGLVDFAISFDAEVWSREAVIFEYRQQFAIMAALPFLFLCGVLILVVFSSLCKMCRGSGKNNDEVEIPPIVAVEPNDDRTVGFRRKGGARRRHG